MCADRKGNVLAMKILKMLGWTILAVVIIFGAMLFCVVKFLNSGHLSPIIEEVAGNYIEGQLKLGDIKVGFHRQFSVLGVEIDNLTIISHAFDSLTAGDRGLLPDYADSLLTLDHMTGSLDLKRLIVNNELSLHDVVLRGLGVNLVISHNGQANYDMMRIHSDSVKSPKGNIHGFRINRFALEHPKEIRFYNAADSTSASVLLLTNAAVDGNSMPTYSLRIDGNVTSPKATLITNLDRISFGLNGKVFWDPAHPGLVVMEEMELQGAFIKAIVTGEVDFDNSPVIRSAVVDLKPVAITDLLTMVPDSVRRIHSLYEPYFSTDAAIGGRFELTEPMDLTTDTLPSSRIKLCISPAALRYGDARFDEVALDMTVNTLTNRPDSTVIDINRCILAGPSTRLEVSALLSTLFSDPSFDTSAHGNIDLADMPPVIRELIPGYLSGLISTDLRASGRTSMFRHGCFHRIIADGSVTARDVYFLSADIGKMVELSKARIDFGIGKFTDDIPLSGAKVYVDTASILINGVDIALSSLTLRAEIEKAAQYADTTLLPTIGGPLNVNRLNIISITDSAGARIQNLDGNLVLRTSEKHNRMPEILADLRTGHVSAGTLSDRILLDNTAIKAVLHKLQSAPGKPITPSPAKNIRKKKYPYISPDSVFRLVYARRHHKPGEKRTRRVYGTMAADNNEILKWNLAGGFKKFLTGWKLNGSLITRQARLLTPIFPLHNRFSLLDLKFSNDTVDISDISLRVGRSDITMSGLVSNVRRALTSATDNTLKINLSLLSDTIDINELSLGAFTGASYAERRRRGKSLGMGTDNDDALEIRLDVLAKEGPGPAAPLLIPVNIDANIRIDAENMLYGDLAMQNMGGDLLVYGGGVNIHQVKANSDAGNISVSALYSAPGPENMHFGFGMELEDFNIGKFVKLVPAVDSIIPLIHDFSGTVGADIAATCRIDSGMNLILPSLNAAIRISGDNLAFINPHTYHTLGKWLGFKDKTDNTIRSMNVEMTVADGMMRVYPFAFNIDRYRLGISGSNDIAMNFDYHISVLKSPIPFKFGINISGNPKKYKVRFGGAKFNENTAVESVNIVNNARINLIDQIENVFRRGVRNSRFAGLQIDYPEGIDAVPDPGLSAADSLQLIREGLIDAPVPATDPLPANKSTKKRKRFLFF